MRGSAKRATLRDRSFALPEGSSDRSGLACDSSPSEGAQRATTAVCPLTLAPPLVAWRRHACHRRRAGRLHGGVAVDRPIDDPVTRYVPELAARDPRFKQVTLRELLTMSSGLRYRESSFPSPRGDDTNTYYGVDLRKHALEQTRIEQAPGREWHYNNYNPLLLGLAPLWILLVDRRQASR
jgi:Beta-lactamase